MRKFAIAALALLVAGCASIKNPVNNPELATLVSTYGVAQSFVIAYKGLPRCTKTSPATLTNPCAARSIVVQLQAADLKANSAINGAVRFTENNPTLDGSSLINAAQLAVSALQDLEKASGVIQ